MWRLLDELLFEEYSIPAIKASTPMHIPAAKGWPDEVGIAHGDVELVVSDALADIEAGQTSLPSPLFNVASFFKRAAFKSL